MVSLVVRKLVGAVIGAVRYAIAISVIVTHVAKRIAGEFIEVALVRIGNGGTIVKPVQNAILIVVGVTSVA